MPDERTPSNDDTCTLATGRRKPLLSLMDMVSVLRSSNTSSTTFPSSGMENTTSRGPADVVPEPKRINELHTATGGLPGLEEHDPPSIDEKQQHVDAELFYGFERRIEKLYGQLRDFENASRELGNSVGIVSSAFRLQGRLAKILFLFRENAVCLCPYKILRKPQELPLSPGLLDRRQDWRKRSTIPLSQDNLELDMLPNQLESLARDVGSFISCLCEFEEFTDEAINQSMRTFEVDLRYFSSCLYKYGLQSRSPAEQRYIHDLMPKIGGPLDEITAALTIFIEIGIPTIWFHQQHVVKNLLNVSVLSIFFGVVNALLLVLSYEMTGNNLASSVNIFWMSSLVFSIAGGVNGLLGLTLKQSGYHSPVQRVPWWALAWMEGSPLVLLIIAVVCLSTGIVFFTFSSGQSRVTSGIALVLTLLASSGLICISSWFVLERWTFLTQKDQKWLGEVISEVLDEFAELGIVRAHRCAMQWCSRHFTMACAAFARLIVWLANTRILKAMTKKVPTIADDNAGGTVGETAHLQFPSRPGEGLPDSHGQENDAHPPKVRDPRVRFQNAVRAVIKLQHTTGKRATPVRSGIPRRDPRWHTSMLSDGDSPVPDPGVYVLRGTMVAKVIENFKALDMTQELFPHGALVRHLQFSPSGKYLATASWDRKAMIFRVGETFTHHRTLAHVRGLVSQVAWSPNSRLLLTRFTSGLKLWSEEGVCIQTIDRPKAVSSVVWLPNGQAILSVEESDVVKLDPQGKALDTYHFGHVQLINVAVTSDSARLIAIGPSVPPENGPQPTRQTKVEKRMILYNMRTKRKESQTPLYNDVRDVVISKRMSIILVSFQQAAPQLWKLQIIRDRSRTSGENLFTGQLVLKHTFTFNEPTIVVGSCYFGGKDEQFVCCTGEVGDMHIWDRETATLLHYIRPMCMPKLRDTTCMGWNNVLNGAVMFATGSRDGKVRVWSTAVVQQGAPGSSAMVLDE